MKNIIKTIALLLFAAVVMVGTPPITLNIEDYWYEVVDDAEGNPGGGLLIEWTEPYTGGGSNIFGCTSSDSEEQDLRYIITVDGVDADTVTETFYTLYTPAKTIELTALEDMEYKSESPAVIEFSTVTTPSLVVWSIKDTTGVHPAGFGFHLGSSGGGDASAYMIGEGYDDMIDFYLDTNLVLAASNRYEPDGINDRQNMICEHEEAYDSIRIVKPYTTDGDYVSEIRCETDDVYGLRIDRDNTEWFAKIAVLNINYYEIAFKIDLQPQRNLRWVVTEDAQND